MNSLVVLFSVMMLAGAKPAIPAVYTFPAPAVAIDPAAVAEQTRIVLQSAPAIYKTNVIDSSIVPAPVAYSAPVAIAPASVSTQSRLDIKSSPAVVSTLATAPVAYNAALAYGAPLTYGASIAYGAPLATAFAPSIYTPAVTAAITPTLMKTAMAPEAESVPAKEDSINQALPVAPTETPEVAAARAAHLAAKAAEEAHQIQKRSVIATSPVVTSYAAPLVTSYASSPVVYSSPIARITPVGVHTPILSGAYGIHPY